MRGLRFNPNDAQKCLIKCHTNVKNKNLHINDKSIKLNESHYNQQLQERKSQTMIDAKKLTIKISQTIN